jgi:hypothetical protein
MNKYTLRIPYRALIQNVGFTIEGTGLIREKKT